MTTLEYFNFILVTMDYAKPFFYFISRKSIVKTIDQEGLEEIEIIKIKVNSTVDIER
ncbi:MAG: hypothetical protein RO257_04615 [Candidatus Kapabacteria bacterium]|nr:hypothetical protein [Candidatus Kapabacteria bacterium]